MMNDDNTVELIGVHEYCEDYPVNFKYNSFISDEMEGPRDVVIATNEGGFNTVWIDAYELYFALKNIYERS